MHTLPTVKIKRNDYFEFDYSVDYSKSYLTSYLTLIIKCSWYNFKHSSSYFKRTQRCVSLKDIILNDF